MCGKWFAKDEDDGLIVREIDASKEDGKSYLPLNTYDIEVITGDRHGAGTDANVSIVIHGEHGDSGVVPLENKLGQFKRKSSANFSVSTAHLGLLTKIRIGHDGTGIGSGWFLDKVIVNDAKTNKDYFFLVGKWFAKDEDDGAIMREIVPADSDGKTYEPYVTYEVSVVTGDRMYSGTDAQIFITIFGEKGNTGKRILDNPKKHPAFERGQTDVFGVSTTYLGDLKKILIGHDNSGVGPGWFLDKVIIKDPQTNQQVFFLCGKWFADDEDDKQIVREIPSQKEDGSACDPLVHYNVVVMTGDRRGAGTDATVSIFIEGEKGNSGDRILDASFTRSSVHKFAIPCVDLGPIKQIRIGHDNRGVGPGWFLDRVIVRDTLRSAEHFFVAGRWLAQDEDDGKTSINILPSKPSDVLPTPALTTYRVSIFTGDVRGAGTDALVFLELFGDKGKTGEKKLDAGREAFEKGKKDEFGIEVEDLGNLQRLRIGHDGSGFGPGWFLDKVVVRNEASGQQWFFLSGQWFDSTQGDGKIVRDIIASTSDGVTYSPLTKYLLEVRTADRKGAGTKSNVFVTLYGSTTDSGEQALEGPDSFKSGGIDHFEISTSDLGALSKINVRHDNSGWGANASWFVDKFIVTNQSTGQRWFFLIGKHLSLKTGEKKISCQVPASKEDGTTVLPLSLYKFTFLTGDTRGAGTNANVFIQVFGKNGDSGVLQLEGEENSFERGQRSTFGYQLVDLGDIQKIKVGHDNSGFFPGWFLVNVLVRNEKTGQEYNFPSDQWFDKDKGDGQIARELYPAPNSGQVSTAVGYEVLIVTANRHGAGTEANVFLQVFGTSGETERMALGKGKFDRGQTHKHDFQIKDLGALTKIRMGHDNSGIGPGWMVDKVTVKNLRTEDVYEFPVFQWFDKGEADGKIVRDIEVSSKDQ
uniref:PLAT domain-containing protein n=1 Tax=Arcella intermedia TaxID=1963864 RepID=A0A6B2KXQ4_9EUKA